ncbi:hypothetical protein SCYAM73S_01560 [Streptomyces cyaneofuscatus]
MACAVAFHFLIPKARNFTPGTLNPKALAKTVATHLGNPLLVRLYAIGALFMTVFGAVYTVIGYRLVEEPFSLPQGIVGSIFLVYLVGTVSSAAAGRLVARLGRRGALYLAVSTTAAGLLLSLSESLAAVLLGLVLITAGFFAGHAVASSSVSRTATTGRAQASALYQSAYYLGSSAAARWARSPSTRAAGRRRWRWGCSRSSASSPSPCTGPGWRGPSGGRWCRRRGDPPGPIPEAVIPAMPERDATETCPVQPPLPFARLPGVTTKPLWAKGSWGTWE